MPGLLHLSQGALPYAPMRRARSPFFSQFRRLRLCAVVLAVLGQIGLSGASLTLARDERSAVSHTERNGIDLHYAHNEATCAACTALSLHGTPRVPIAWQPPRPPDNEITSLVPRDRGAQLLFSNLSRAPPGIR